MTHEEDTKAEHAEIREKVEDIHQALEYHIGEFHETVTESYRGGDAAVMECVVQNSEKIEALKDEVGSMMNALVGPYDSLIGHRREKEGVVHKVDEMHRQFANGGIKAKLDWRAWSLIFTAAAAAILRLFGVEIPAP